MTVLWRAGGYRPNWLTFIRRMCIWQHGYSITQSSLCRSRMWVADTVEVQVGADFIESCGWPYGLSRSQVYSWGWAIIIITAITPSQSWKGSEITDVAYKLLMTMPTFLTAMLKIKNEVYRNLLVSCILYLRSVFVPFHSRCKLVHVGLRYTKRHAI